MKKTSTIILLIIIIFSNAGCKRWFCDDGGTVYKIVDYKVKFQYIDDNGSINFISNDNFVSKYNRLIICGAPIREYLHELNDCPTHSIDSTINYITKFDIFSNKDYNEEFSSNDNLNNLFTTQFNRPETLNQKLSSQSKIIRPELYFPSPPSQTDTFIFNVYVELNDGQSFNIQTIPIIITP